MTMNAVSPLPVAQPQQSPDEIIAAEQAEREKRAQRGPVYWAADAPDKVIAELERKKRSYFEFLRRRGFVAMWRTMIAQWHGLDPDGASNWATQTIALDGDRGELLRFRVNETRSFVKQLITMAIGQRPAFEATAINTDYSSIGQAEAADAIIEYVYWSLYGEKKERKTVTRGVLLGLGWTWVNWDVYAGEWVTVDEPVTVPDPVSGQPIQRVDPKTGEPMVRKVRTGERSGQLTIKARYPWEVFHETRVEDFDDHLWAVARDRRSRHELIAAFPEKADKLRGATDDEYTFEKLFGIDSYQGNDSSDDELTVEHFYHLPSDAFSAPTSPGEPDFRQGRYLMYAAGECLRDVPLPYDELPIEPFCPSEYFCTAFGYADAWDLVAVNQMIDEMYSIIASNYSAFGRQSVAVWEGTDYSPDKIANGMNVFTVPPNAAPPAAVQLAHMPAGALDFTGNLIERLQSLTALNSVARGNPSANISSGQMAALFHSIAIEANSALQSAVDSHRERLANKILNMLRRYASHPLMAKIAGIDERAYLETFTRDSFKSVKGVVIKTSNPMMRTTAGKMQLAEYHLKVPGAITDPAQINEIMVSGQLKPLYDGPRKARMRIRFENEALAKGPSVQEVVPPPLPPLPNGQVMPAPAPYTVVPGVPVMITDDHRKHIMEHAAVLASPEAIRDEAFRTATETHIRHHFKVWRETDPSVLMALGHAPFPRAEMAMPAPPPANDNGDPQARGDLPPQGPPQQNGQLTAGSDIDMPRPAQPPPGAKVSPAA